MGPTLAIGACTPQEPAATKDAKPAEPAPEATPHEPEATPAPKTPPPAEDEPSGDSTGTAIEPATGPEWLVSAAKHWRQESASRSLVAQWEYSGPWQFAVGHHATLALEDPTDIESLGRIAEVASRESHERLLRRTVAESARRNPEGTRAFFEDWKWKPERRRWWWTAALAGYDDADLQAPGLTRKAKLSAVGRAGPLLEADALLLRASPPQQQAAVKAVRRGMSYGHTVQALGTVQTVVGSIPTTWLVYTYDRRAECEEDPDGCGTRHPSPCTKAAVARITFGDEATVQEQHALLPEFGCNVTALRQLRVRDVDNDNKPEVVVDMTWDLGRDHGPGRTVLVLRGDETVQFALHSVYRPTTLGVFRRLEFLDDAIEVVSIDAEGFVGQVAVDVEHFPTPKTVDEWAHAHVVGIERLAYDATTDTWVSKPKP